ncbi:MAG: hypothetical protein IKH24_00970, partial [Bacteroidales bacterium]|nr:hypothetical protein [Bacteroidales bacterium]
MKPFYLLLPLAAILAGGCVDFDGDEPLPVDDTVISGISVPAIDETTFATNIVAAGTAATTTYNFGDADTSDDNIAGTTFDRIISIVFGGSQATVTGDENGIVSVSGNHVTVNN